MEEYRTIEERIFIASGVKNFLVGVVPTYYETVADLFRIPTLSRKLINKQGGFSCFKGASGIVDRGILIGIVLGVGTNVALLAYSALEVAAEGNYTPLAALGITNLASGIFELGRLSKSKEERLELEKRV